MSEDQEKKETIEEELIRFWNDNQIFQKSVAAHKDAKPFVFFEGPPTANGAPHMGHAETRAFKDIVLRYKTMRGYYVPRRAGWDTQGLPVEIEVEKKLGLKTKKDVDAFGIAKFNKACRESAWKYKEEWMRFSDRLGFWIDNENAYVTYENSYLESLWWIIKEVWKKGLLYEDNKILPWCPRCETGLSSHELAQGYEKIRDTALYVKFKLIAGQRIGEFTTDDQTYILSWTTTPWTLAGNVALAVCSDIQYIRATVSKSNVPHLRPGETYIFAAAPDADKRVLGVVISHPESGAVGTSNDSGIVLRDISDFSGDQLTGLSYEPLFNVPDLQSKNSHKVYGADFVVTNEGTGVVHIAPMYGEDDYQLGKKYNLPSIHTVTESGKFSDLIPELVGLPVKDKKTDAVIIKLLREKNNPLKEEEYEHDYPFCWRCKSPVIYYARKSWWIGMSELRDELIKRNEGVHWIPSHVKEGRFGEWLREVKDWAFSRARFWGTPLPIWKCERCAAHDVIGSLEELKDRTVPYKNRYLLMRHGEAAINVAGISSSNETTDAKGLTAAGKIMVEGAAKELKKTYEKMDLIYSSPLPRTFQTAEIVAGEYGVKEAAAIKDARLIEYQFGEFEGKPIGEHLAYFSTRHEQFERPLPGGESFYDIRRRVLSFFKEIEETNEGKTILIISHAAPIWLLETGLNGRNGEESIADAHGRKEKLQTEKYIHLSEVRELEARPLPVDEVGHLDLHRPYIDTIRLLCDCGGRMTRIPELADVWFDSGAMPFAKEHYPFIDRVEIDSGKKYPADYITEGIDQTRGWFYTLLAVATLLNREAPYRAVISLGHVLDRNGKKMSKSLGNVVHPMDTMEKFGADVLRWYFFTVNQPGEVKLFDERDLLIRKRNYIDLLTNSLAFWKLTYDETKPGVKEHVLDRWLEVRLRTVASQMTLELDHYRIVEAARLLEVFVAEDISRWYIRRSRSRLKEEGASVLGHALACVAVLTAPFTPFIGEHIYKTLGGKKESVHLEEWPESNNISNEELLLLQKMDEVRRIVSLALEERSKVGIKIRQPLSLLQVSSEVLDSNDVEFLHIIGEEVNVKSVEVSKDARGITLNTELTPELLREGALRELIRQIQQLRKEAGLRPNDTVAVRIGGHEQLREFASILERETKTRIEWSGDGVALL